MGSPVNVGATAGECRKRSDGTKSDNGGDPAEGGLRGYVLILVDYKIQAVYRELIH